MSTELIKRVVWLFSSVALAMVLISCGGGSSSDGSGTSSRGTGTVGILLTDMPADPSMFVSVNASIEAVELMGSDDGGKVSLYNGPTKTFDLLRLKNESIPFSFQDGIPAGTYCKIRLTLSDLELVLTDNTPNDLDDNETYHPHLPGNGKLDLVARDCFEVAAGEVLTLQLDIDAGNSIHIVGNNNGFNFRPVVFVDVINQQFDSKLVRLQGTIHESDEAEQTFLLCDAIPTQNMYSEGCVEIELGENSAFFDNQNYSGAPRALDELLEQDKVGETVTVVGWPRYWVPPYMDIEIPDGHLPALGECRLWEIGVEPGQQDAPVDCDDIPEVIPQGVVVVTHEGIDKDPYHPLMVVEALAVELGEFLQVEGEVATDADSDGFTMDVSLGQPVITQDTLTVALQKGASSDINGTRIVTKSGEILEALDITVPLPIQVDGVLDLNTDILNAALVIVDTSVINAEQVTGTVLSVENGAITINPDADTVCGNATESLLVTLDSELEILTVTITDDGSTITPGGELALEQTVGMNGECTSGGYATDNVVIVDDQRTI